MANERIATDFSSLYRKLLTTGVFVLINTIWIGGEMGPVHAACLRSFIRHGHDILLHCYERPKDAPHGVQFFDARKLMNENEIMRHKKTGTLFPLGYLRVSSFATTYV